MRAPPGHNQVLCDASSKPDAVMERMLRYFGDKIRPLQQEEVKNVLNDLQVVLESAWGPRMEE